MFLAKGDTNFINISKFANIVHVGFNAANNSIITSIELIDISNIKELDLVG